MAAADPFHAVLERVVDFVSTVVMCDSCFVYVLENDKLVLRASKNPHADLWTSSICNWARELRDGSRCTNSL